MRGRVGDSKDLRRVAALTRRPAEVSGTLELELTRWLRAEGGTMSLRPVQARALEEMHDRGGLLAPMRVGSGKTLVALLAPVVLSSKRPMLLVPGALVHKTVEEWEQYARHFRCPRPHVVSYSKLGRVDAAEVLQAHAPDLIVADEAHKLKNRRAAVTRRVMRYLHQNPECRLVAMSGTITSRSIADYAHLAARALGEGSPAPLSQNTVDEWCMALDEKVDDVVRFDPGDLFELGGEEPRALTMRDKTAAARAVFMRRMLETPGVVAASGRGCDASIDISGVTPKRSPEIQAAFRRLRTTWETPDGHPIADGATLWRHAREIACGFFYVWDPRPPRAWLDARRDWAAACRHVLGHNQRHLDSELQVAQAVDRGLYPEVEPLLRAWRAVRDTFTPRTVPVWIDAAPLLDCVKPSHQVIWVEHGAVGDKISRALSVPYFREGGRDERGSYIEDFRGPQCVVSVAANAEGRNLQRWSRCLVTSPPPNGKMWEQLIGRMHREGQEADEIEIDVLFGCDEARRGFDQARADARYVQETTGQEQKLCIATVVL